MSKRVFIALPISAQLQTTILAWEDRFRNLPVRWLKGESLHVTLIPPWEEIEVGRVIEELRQFKALPLAEGRYREGVSHNTEDTAELSLSPMALHFDRVTCGPHAREPRLIWAEGAPVHELSVVRSQLYRVLGFKPDTRPFKLHVTLARFRPEHFHSFPLKTLNERVDWNDAINSFVLMESRLLPRGAEYEVLAEIPLSEA